MISALSIESVAMIVECSKPTSFLSRQGLVDSMGLSA